MNVNKYRLCIYRMHLLFFSVIKIDDAHARHDEGNHWSAFLCASKTFYSNVYFVYLSMSSSLITMSDGRFRLYGLRKSLQNWTFC